MDREVDIVKTNWQDPLSGEVISPDIAGLQEAVGKIEDALDMKVVNATNIPLEEIYISENDHYRIYQAPGKRNWVYNPAPVIKVNGTPVSSGFTINHGGGAVVFEPPLTANDTVTADFNYVSSASDRLNTQQLSLNTQRTDIDAQQTEIDTLENNITTHTTGTTADNVHGLSEKVIESSGSNEKGNYIRFSDGTQVCWQNYYIGICNFTTQTANAVYGGHTDKLTFPAPFIANPVAIVNAKSTGYLNAQCTSVTTTALDIRIWSNYSSTHDSVTRDYIAIGRWK